MYEYAYECMCIYIFNEPRGNDANPEALGKHVMRVRTCPMTTAITRAGHIHKQLV
jgi:hypothetical protein